MQRRSWSSRQTKRSIAPSAAAATKYRRRRERIRDGSRGRGARSQLLRAPIDLRAEFDDVLADGLVHGLALAEPLDRGFQCGGVGGNALEAVAAAGALQLMREIRQPLQRLGRALGELRLDLGDLLLRLREKLALQLFQLQIDNHGERMLHAVCRKSC